MLGTKGKAHTGALSQEDAKSLSHTATPEAGGREAHVSQRNVVLGAGAAQAAQIESLAQDDPAGAAISSWPL